MSDEANAGDAASQPGMDNLLDKIPSGVMIGLVVGAALVALGVLVSLVLMLSLSSDVARLEDRVRAMHRTLKTLEEAGTHPKAGSALPAAAGDGGAAPAKSAPPKPTHMDAADPGRDCVIRSGSKEGLAGCLK